MAFSFPNRMILCHWWCAHCTLTQTVQQNKLIEMKINEKECERHRNVLIQFLSTTINYSTLQFVIDNVVGCDWTFAPFQLLLFMCKCILFLLAEFRYCVPIGLLLSYLSVWSGFFSLFLVPSVAVVVRNRILQINAIKTECVFEKNETREEKLDLKKKTLTNWIFEWFGIWVPNQWGTSSQCSLHHIVLGAWRFRVRKPQLHYNSKGITYMCVCAEHSSRYFRYFNSSQLVISIIICAYENVVVINDLQFLVDLFKILHRIAQIECTMCTWIPLYLGVFWKFEKCIG